MLRDYQQQAVDSVYKEWDEGNRSTVIVLPTGTGKTVCFSEVIRRMHPKRALVIAHREELIFQAKEKIEHHANLECEIEMGSFRASANFWNHSPVVVSTVQTQCSGNEGKGRMARFDPMDFGLLIVDECHHGTADTYKRVLDHYKQNPDLKVLGVTATPDRADEEALGKIFQSVAFDYEILDAIHGGWLVPIEQQMVTVDGLDFSAIRTTAGDLNGADLAEVMEAEKNLQGIASASLQIIGERKTLIFTVSVRQAEQLAEIFNRHRPGMADWVCGKTPKEDRRDKLIDFKSGRTQVMVNVGVLTEGYDNPSVEVIIQARPTKSRCLYSQMVGRATRPLPGIVDGLPDAATRRLAIAESLKPSMLVVDFVGNSGKHKLVNTADILGGKVSEEAIARAVAKAKKDGKPIRMDEALDEAQHDILEEIEERKKQEAARKARLIAKASYRVTTISPFDVFHLEPERERGWDAGKTLSEKQRSILQKQGIDPSSMSYHQSKQVIGELFRRWKEKLATFKQCKLLEKHGYTTKEMTMKQASAIIDSLAKNNWNRQLADRARESQALIKEANAPF